MLTSVDVWSTLRCGDCARIVALQTDDAGYRQQLLAMGLVPGVEFKLVHIAPLGDPIALALLGGVISVRRHEMQAVMIEKVAV